MKRTGKVLKLFLLSIGLAGVFLTFFILHTPIVDATGGVSVDCPGGITLECGGTGAVTCEGTNNVGCSCKDSRGKIIDQKKCPKADEMEEPEDEPVS